jgi:hypothetical protein
MTRQSGYHGNPTRAAASQTPVLILFLLVFGLALCAAGENESGLKATWPVNPLIRIENAESGLSETSEVSVTLADNIYEMGGFDFLISYDIGGLTFMEADPGQFLEDCAWEYFTYRYEGTGIVGIVSIADINNGPYHPSCYGPPDTDPHELAKMTFQVTGNLTYEDLYVPIKFFWTDCGDNAVSSVDGEILFVSDHVYDFEGTDITDSTFGFPTYFGIQSGCLEGGEPGDPVPIQYIDFQSGSLYIYGEFVCGDANGNGNVNILDITYLINYLYMGGPRPVPLVSADVNNNGLVNILDITYLINYLYRGGPDPVCP